MNLGHGISAIISNVRIHISDAVYAVAECHNNAVKPGDEGAEFMVQIVVPNGQIEYRGDIVQIERLEDADGVLFAARLDLSTKRSVVL